MAPILSHPFRLAGNGAVATVEQSDDVAHAEQIGVLIATRRGERPMVPAFGITDPTHAAPDLADIAAGVELFGPPVTVVDVTFAYLDAASARVEVTFDTGSA